MLLVVLAVFQFPYHCNILPLHRRVCRAIWKPVFTLPVGNLLCSYSRLLCYFQGVESCPLSVLFLAGGVAGCVSWTSSYPADVIKSRMQLGDKFYQTRWRSAPTRITYSHHIRMALHKEGFSGLFRGLPSTYIRALPNNGAALTIVAVFHSLVERSSLLRTHGCIAYDYLWPMTYDLWWLMMYFIVLFIVFIKIFFIFGCKFRFFYFHASFKSFLTWIAKSYTAQILRIYDPASDRKI